MLASTQNPFGGRIVDEDTLPTDPREFATLLEASVEAWRSEGCKVVWLRLPLHTAALVPIAVESGFVYHHATEDAVQLTLTLVHGSYVPPFATHYIGAGGVVLRRAGEERPVGDTRANGAAAELLVVSEAYRTRRHYKLPGGALHPGEHIVDAALREVKEETGIDTSFESLVCFRHWHGYRHGKSDIYFVCRLKPLSFEIERDETEISECFWMPVEEYLAHPDVHAFNRRIVAAALGREADGVPAGGDPAVGLVPIDIPGYGTAETHEFFLPG